MNNLVVDAIIENILDSRVINEPFPHLFVENIFPIDFYKELLRCLPKKSIYKAINATGSVGTKYSEERFVFNYTENEEINLLEENIKNFFKDLKKILFSEKIFSSTSTVFKKTLDSHLLNLSDEEKNKIDFPNLKFNFRSTLIKDFTKYSLGAHTDAFSKFINFLFYIPSNDHLMKNGTSLYKPITEIQSTKHFNFEDTKKYFQKIKTCPFVPNSVLIFPRTARSFHGVEEININRDERNLLLLNYYLDLKK